VFKRNLQYSPFSKILSHAFPSDLIQGDYLSLLFFNFHLEYAIRKIQENQEKVKMNGRQKFLVYADDANFFGWKHKYYIEKQRKSVICQ
jgi:hypothetical protein